MNVVHFSCIYVCFFRLSGLCPFRLGLFILVEFVRFSLVERCFLLRPPFRVNSYQFFLSNKFVFCFVYLLLVFFPVFSSRPLCPKQKVFCGHFKALWDNHPSCANCFHCSRQNTCEICCSWSLSTWLKFEQRRSYKARMERRMLKRRSSLPVKPKKKSAPASRCSG